MINNLIAVTAFALALCATFATVAFAQEAKTKVEWNRFRGPNGSGIHSTSKAPLEWSNEKNLKWKCKLPGPGTSSPVFSGNKVFLTAHSTEPVGKAGHEKYLLCIDLQSGSMLWKRKIRRTLVSPDENFKLGKLKKSGLAPHTPATDGDQVFAFFGTDGLYAFDMSGIQQWHVPTGDGLSQFGSGTSPIVYGDQVFLQAGVECGKLFAINKRSGTINWQLEVESQGKSYSTPIVANRNGEDELVVNLIGKLVGLSLSDGSVNWSYGYRESVFQCATPVVSQGMTFIWTDGRLGYAAIDTNRAKDISEPEWSYKIRRGYVTASPAVFDGELICIYDSVLDTIESKSGKLIDSCRLETVFEDIYSSPIRIRDYWMVLGLNGKAILWPEKDALSKSQARIQNTLNEDAPFFAATPAVTDSEILIRSNQFLYCISDIDAKVVGNLASSIKPDDVVAAYKSASILAKQGKTLEAIRICETELEKVKRTNNVSVLEHGKLMSLAGNLHFRIGNLDRAAKLLEANLAFLEKNNMPLLARCSACATLSAINSSNKKYAEAKVVCKKCLALLSQVDRELAKESQEFQLCKLVSLQTLTKSHDSLGEYEEAKKTQKMWLDHAEEVYGRESASYCKVLLRNLDIPANRSSEVVVKGKRLLSLLKKLGENESEDAAVCSRKLAHAYLSLGNEDGAVAIAKNAVEFLDRRTEIPRLELAYSAGLVGKVLLKRGNAPDAQKFLEVAVKAASQTKLADSIRLGLLQNLATANAALGDYENAIFVAGESVDLSIAMHGKESVEHGLSLVEYADCLARSFQKGNDIAKVTNAIDMFLSAIEILEKKAGPAHIAVARAHHDLGTNLWRWGLLDKAEIHLTTAITRAESNPKVGKELINSCLLYTSPSPRDRG